MSRLAKLSGLFKKKAATASYKPTPQAPAFVHMRHLPHFTFQTIRWMLHDPTIRLGLAMRSAPMAQAEFAWQDNKGEWVPGVQADSPEVGKFVERQLQRIWTFELHKVLSSQVWGWSAGEVTYKNVDGKWEVDGLLHRLAEDCFALTKGGEVSAVRIKRIPGAPINRVDLPFPKAWWHAHDPEAENPYGRSILRCSYSPWADKWLNGGALDVRRLFAHKDAYGGVDMSYPPGTTNIDGKGEVPNRDIAREITEQLKAGGVTQRPSVFDPNGNNQWELTRATIPANPSHIFEYPRQLDVEMLQGMEIPEDILMSDAGGAWQGKQVPMQAFFVMAETWLAQVVRAIVTQILEPLVLENWGRAEEFEVTTKPLAEQAMEQIGDSRATPAQEETETGEFITLRNPDGTTFLRRNPKFTQQRFGLDDRNTAEIMVGQGVVEASHLVEAGRRFMLGANVQTNGNGKHKKKKPAKPRRLSIATVSRMAGLNHEETDMLTRLSTNGR